MRATQSCGAFRCCRHVRHRRSRCGPGRRRTLASFTTFPGGGHRTSTSTARAIWWSDRMAQVLHHTCLPSLLPYICAQLHMSAARVMSFTVVAQLQRQARKWTLMRP